MPESIKPLLRWAGSKRQLLTRFAPLFPTHYSRYHEPFAGSACVFFHIKPDKAVISDINEELVETLKFVRDFPDELTQEIKKLEKSRENYYLIRSQDPASLPPPIRTARFIYLNRFCFNGLYRTNLKGEFNVPYAPQKSGSLPDKNQIIYYSQLLRNAELLCEDFENVNARVSRNDFVYLDPPFNVSTRRVFREYHEGRFTRNDLLRLSKLLNTLDRKGAKFMLSYAYGKDAKEFFGDWNIKKLLDPLPKFSAETRIMTCTNVCVCNSDGSHAPTSFRM